MNSMKNSKASFNIEKEETGTGLQSSFVSQFFVFQGEDYLGWNCFNKGEVSVGRSNTADLVLNDQSVSDLQAIFYFKDDQIVVTDESNGNGVLVNGKVKTTCVLGPLDFVSIGPYTIKIKFKRVADHFSDIEAPAFDAPTMSKDTDSEPTDTNDKEGSETENVVIEFVGIEKDDDREANIYKDSQDTNGYKLVFDGRIVEGSNIRDVKRNLAALLNVDENKIERVFSGRRIVIKRDVDYQTATKYKEVFEKAGAICTVEAMKRSTGQEPQDLRDKIESSKSDEIPEVELIREDIETEDEESESIIIKKDRDKNSQNIKNYKLVFDGKITEGCKIDDVKRNMATLLKLDGDKIEQVFWQIFSGRRILIKDYVNYQTAVKHKEALERAGAICAVEAINIHTSPETEPLRDKIESLKSDEVPEVELIREDTEIHITASESAVMEEAGGRKERTEPQHALSVSPAISDEEEDYDEDGDDEEYEDELVFLREKITDFEQAGAHQIKGDTTIEVVKFREDSVVDVCFLNNREKYYRVDGDGRFCLAENKNSKECFFYFNDQFNGKVRINGTVSKDVSKLCVQENLFRKRKKIFRDLLPNDGDVVISDGYYDYLLRRVVRNKSPQVAEPPKNNKDIYKNLVRSAGFHIVFLIFLGLFASFPDDPVSHRPESRFVQIDASQLAKKMQPVKKPKKVQPAQKPVEKPRKTVKAKKKKKITVAQTPKVQKRKIQKGNVATRNVKQAGVLGMLGDSIGLKPKEALAVVTNLDAVSSRHIGKANFKVGGIVGKLNSSKIEVPSAGIVNTKGSKQVLRTAGTLEKGGTGRKQVMAMVTADLGKTVHIKGGMSREAVKRVIDRHLDEITFCYESALTANPSLMGKVVFEWKILISGRVGEVKIKSSSINSNEIHFCIKDAIKTWQFPKPKDSEVIVSYPFIFDIVGF